MNVYHYTSVANACEFVSGLRPFRPYWPMNEPSSFIPNYEMKKHTEKEKQCNNQT